MKWRECGLYDALAWASARTVEPNADPAPPDELSHFDGVLVAAFTDGSAVAVRSCAKFYESGSFIEDPEFWIGEP